MEKIHKRLNSENEFSTVNIEKIIRGISEQIGVSAGKLIHPIRLALTGDIASPGIFEIIEILGKEKVSRRINNAIQYIESIENVPAN